VEILHGTLGLEEMRAADALRNSRSNVYIAQLNFLLNVFFSTLRQCLSSRANVISHLLDEWLRLHHSEGAELESGAQGNREGLLAQTELQGELPLLPALVKIAMRAAKSTGVVQIASRMHA
jgi:hypothetical protein